MEVWKDIQGYKGLFQISNLGNVKRKEKTYFCCNNTKRVLCERLIVGGIIKGGYRRVELWNDGKYKKCMVHRLVAEAFIPNPDNKPEIDHIDGNPLNNRVDNLKWCNHCENLNNPITRQRKSEAIKRFYKNERSKKWRM